MLKNRLLILKMSQFGKVGSIYWYLKVFSEMGIEFYFKKTPARLLRRRGCSVLCVGVSLSKLIEF